MKVGRRAVIAGVGQPDGVLFGAERGDRGDGAEDLLTEDGGIVGDVSQDGGLVEVAGTVNRRAAGDGGGSGPDGGTHQGLPCG